MFWPWFDQTVLTKADMETLELRDRQRWVDLDKDEDSIRAKRDGNDMPNVRLVYERSSEPDWIVCT